MPRIYLCFLWHMHQPFYKDLATGEYKLPWTRMHALKDYYGMVKVLEDFPDVHQTFNLVPSMMVQIDEYAAGEAKDPFLRCALTPAEDLSEADQEFILRYFFQANHGRMICRYPRYAELFDAWQAANRNPRRARGMFNSQALRDLQVLSQLAWFDEEFQSGDPEVRALVAKARDYSLADQALMGRKQLEIQRKVIPVYQEFAARGRIEISTTPFYHPILPLLCDSQIADVAHPYVPLPSRFSYPADARHQLDRSRDYVQKRLGIAPAGLWPSEGSVSDEVLAIAADTGFRWLATDNGVLSRTLGRAAGPWETYRPYLWRQNGRSIHALFRDHYLSDLIGFVYSRMDAAGAASHFLDRIRDNCHAILAGGRDALVPVILDGENAWEYYESSGRPFLRDLYRRISADPLFEALTISEALARVPSEPIDRIFPGSWINANFDVWIGAEEDNKAWEYLLRARQAYDRVINGPEGAALSEERKSLAWEELLIAEGSDWCWWYGPEHGSDNRPEFDQLYRDHLANVYRALLLSPPSELHTPIIKVPIVEIHEHPSGSIRAVVDGEVTSYFEWLWAGAYRLDGRSGAMHGGAHLIKELRYGTDGEQLFLRLDFDDSGITNLSGMTARLSFRDVEVAIRFGRGERTASEGAIAEVEAAFSQVLEIAIPIRHLVMEPDGMVRFQMSLWQGNLPMDSLPPQGWLSLLATEPRDWPL